MDMLSFLEFQFLLAPFVAWWALSWWIIVPCAVSFMFSIGCMMPEREDDSDVHPVVASVCLVIIALLTAIGIGYTSKVVGFWMSALEGGKFLVKFLSIYVACGIATLLPLWFVNVRRIGKRIRKIYDEFIKKVLDTTSPMDADKKEEIRKCNGMKDGKILPFLQEMLIDYKNRFYIFPSVNAKDNMGLISSLLFLWPLHIIIEILGEFIAKIPEHVVRLLRFPPNLISRAAVRGLPEDIK